MPLCSKCLMNGIMIDMCKVQFALPELYPEAGFPRHARIKELENTLNFNALECPRCRYQAPLESWGLWQQRKQPTKKQWNILNEKTSQYQLVF